MARVPRKNISKKMADIRPPSPRRSPELARGAGGEEKPIATERAGEFAPLPDPAIERLPARESGEQRKIHPGWFIAAFLALAVVMGAAGALAVYRNRSESLFAAGRDVSGLYRALRGGGASGEDLSSARAAEPGTFLGALSFGDMIAGVRDMGQGLADLQELSSQGAAVTQSAFAALDEAPRWLSGTADTAMVSHLVRIRDTLGHVQEVTSRLSGRAGILEALPFDAGEYVGIQADVALAKQFLDALLPWIAGPDPQYVLVLLENPAELRPGGGFVGSFAVLTVRAGRVESVQVYDVNEADRLLEEKIVPPRPLQLVATRWRSADANWFFDFPASAGKTAELLERSRLFRDRGVRFSAVVGLTPQVVKDLLERTGPVARKDGTLLDSANFLERIQGAVQAGQAATAAYPKEILREFAPLLLARLAGLPSEERAGLAEALRSWVVGRDVRFFSRTPAFQQFFDGAGASGRAFAIPERFAGDYLAVVHANVGGEKSDLRMTQTVTVETQLMEDGTANHRVVVSRTHRGTAKDPSWYRATSRDYLQLAVADSAKLTYADGGEKRSIIPKVNYEKAGYLRDALVAEDEAGDEEHPEYPSIRVRSANGKRVFSTWLTTPRGKTATAAFQYATRYPAPFRAGSPYTLVVERQPAVSGTYRFEISAPIGFVFAERRLPVYTYETDDFPGRFTIELVLAPVN